MNKRIGALEVEVYRGVLLGRIALFIAGIGLAAYVVTGYQVGQEIGGLNVRMNTVEERLGAIEGRLTAVEDKVDTLTERVDALAQRDAALRRPNTAGPVDTSQP
jgi:hypothetical protein